MKFFNYLLVFLLVFTSCKSKKIVVDNIVINNLSARKVAKQHISANFDKKTIDARLKVRYKDSKEDVGFSVKMKIQKDEVIWFQGKKFGMSVFKAKITPTKVSFYSPYKKNYFEGDFSMLKKLLGVDINFNQLQNMLLGQAILNVKSNKQEVEIIEKSYRLSPKKHPVLFDIFFFINPLNFKLNKQLVVNSLKEQRLEIIYPNYLEKKGNLFPERINIFAKEKDKNTLINMTVKSIIFNSKLSMPFKIPSHYKEIKL